MILISFLVRDYCQGKGTRGQSYPPKTELDQLLTLPSLSIINSGHRIHHKIWFAFMD